jgi:hypothetical protein
MKIQKRCKKEQIQKAKKKETLIKVKDSNFACKQKSPLLTRQIEFFIINIMSVAENQARFYVM